MARKRRADIDEVDKRIISLLLNDGRKSHAEMSRLLDLPETTVRDRVGRLIRDDFVRVLAVVNSDRFASVIEVVASVNADPGMIDAVAGALASRRETRSVRRLIGFCDLLVEAGVENEQRLLAYMDFVGAIPGIREVKYGSALHLYKGQYVIPHGWQDRQIVRPYLDDIRANAQQSEGDTAAS